MSGNGMVGLASRGRSSSGIPRPWFSSLVLHCFPCAGTEHSEIKSGTSDFFGAAHRLLNGLPVFGGDS